MHRTQIIGRLGRDPQQRKAGNYDVTVFPVAVDGRKKDETVWYQVTVWGKQAEACAKHLEKGKQVFVDGTPSVRTYEKDGETRANLELSANTVKFL